MTQQQQYSGQDSRGDVRSSQPISSSNISDGMNKMSLGAKPQLHPSATTKTTTAATANSSSGFYVPPFNRNQQQQSNGSSSSSSGGFSHSNDGGFRSGNNSSGMGQRNNYNNNNNNNNHRSSNGGFNSMNQDRNSFGSRGFGSAPQSFNRNRDDRGNSGDFQRRNGPMGTSTTNQRQFPTNFPDGQRDNNNNNNNSFSNNRGDHQNSGICSHEVPPMFLEAGNGHWDAQKGHLPAQRLAQLEEKLFKSEHVSTGINFSKYEEIPVEANGKDVPRAITSFSEAGLTALLQENIELAKYTVPTPVQKFSIPIVKNLRDLMACAQTGSGKTAGFLFPILNDLFALGPQYSRNPCVSNNTGRGYQRKACAYPVVLILAPTRELTSQIYEEAKRFTYRSWVRPVAIYGGVPAHSQTSELRSGCSLLVATPGRLNDLIGRGIINLNHVRYLVLDEADRMLDMGFEPQIRTIVEESDLPPKGKRCTLMFSATFPRAIQHLAADFLNEYVFLSVGRVGSASENVKQSILLVPENQKNDFLLDILGSETQSSKTLIFVETKRLAEMLANFLSERKYPAVAIHGDRTQAEREWALEAFRSGDKPILVATAVAARGLDIPNVTHVVNYDLPNEIDDYVHRIGRTGRAGNMGKSTAFFDRVKNYQISADLVKILTDAKQEVPDFLSLASSRQPQGGSSNNSRFGGNRARGVGARHGGTQRDFRRDPEYNSFTNEQRTSERDTFRRSTNNEW